MALNDVDSWRKGHLAVAEWIDAWRIVPRLLVAGYVWLVYKVVVWYTTLEPHLIPACVSENVVDCIVQAPTTQHAALITAVVGVSAAIFGLYTNSGKKWNGFTHWNKPGEAKRPEEMQSREVVTKTVYTPDDESDGG